VNTIIDQASGRGFTAIHGDCVEAMADLPDNSIDFSVYSPPFSSLYIYSESARDMGNVADDEEFFATYAHAIAEKLRVTKPGRLTAIHVKDLPYYSNASAKGDRGLRPFSDQCTAAHLSAGWTFHSRVTIRRDPVREMQKTKADRLLFKHFREDAARVGQGLPEYLLVFRAWKDGMEAVPPVLHDEMAWRQWRGSDVPPGVTESWLARDFLTDARFDHDAALTLWQLWADPVWEGLPETDVLNVRVARDEAAERHLCPMPLNLSDRAIRLWSNPGEVVLSPFMGIGSEGWSALKAGRRFVGVELKASYWSQAARYLAEAEEIAATGDLFAAE